MSLHVLRGDVQHAQLVQSQDTPPDVLGDETAGLYTCVCVSVCVCVCVCVSVCVRPTGVSVFREILMSPCRRCRVESTAVSLGGA